MNLDDRRIGDSLRGNQILRIPFAKQRNLPCVVELMRIESGVEALTPPSTSKEPVGNIRGRRARLRGVKRLGQEKSPDPAVSQRC